MGKPIKFKEFQASRTRMTRQQYEKECGNEVSAPEVYSYVCFFNIEVHQQTREVGKPMKELYYVVAGSDDFETTDLEKAEKFLYKTMKSELPERKKKEKKEAVDPVKFPRGLGSWLETHFQIVEFMGANGHLIIKENDYTFETSEHSKVIEELDGQCGKQEFAEMLTTEFETKTKDYDWASMSSETTFYEELDKFMMDAFYPKKKFTVTAKRTVEFQTVIEASSVEEAQAIADNLTECDYDETTGDKFEKTGLYS